MFDTRNNNNKKLMMSSNSEKDVRENVVRTSNKKSNRKLDETLILKLAGKKRFDKLTRFLLTEYNETAWHSSIPEETNIQNMDADDTSRVSDSSVKEENISILPAEISPLLHQVLEHRPPFEVIDLICSLLEQQRQHITNKSRNLCCPEDMVDYKGHRPLHIAVIRGCELLVIQRLLGGSTRSSSAIMNSGPPRPACRRDFLGRTPLHWACSNPQGHFGKRKLKTNLSGIFKGSKKELKASVQHQCKVVELLLQDSPEVINIKDKNGQTPLDLAYEKDANPEIIRLLIIAARTFTQNRQSNTSHKVEEPERDTESGVSPPPPQTKSVSTH